ncbi:MAG: hypothetical protein II932_01615 [Treponema sp.]|nr:hypothetical protein [Treponema sp.]
MAEQSEGNKQLLHSLAQMKEGTRAVEDAAAKLSSNTDSVIQAVENIGQGN